MPFIYYYLKIQPPEEGGVGAEEQLGVEGETKIPMDQYYVDEYGMSYGEGKTFIENGFENLMMVIIIS